MFCKISKKHIKTFLYWKKLVFLQNENRYIKATVNGGFLVTVNI